MRLFVLGLSLVLVISVLTVNSACAVKYTTKEVSLNCGQNDITLTNKYSSDKDISEVMQYVVCVPFDKALDKLNEAIKVYPSEPALYNERAMTYQAIYVSVEGEYSQEAQDAARRRAIVDVKKAISLDPENIVYRDNLVELYYHLRDYNAAKKAVAEAQSIKKTLINVSVSCAIDIKLKDPNASTRNISCPELKSLY